MKSGLTAGAARRVTTVAARYRRLAAAMAIVLGAMMILKALSEWGAGRLLSSKAAC